MENLARTGIPVLVLRAIVAMTIMQYFGWRSQTVFALRTGDVVRYNEGFAVSSSHFKTLGPGGLPMGFLYLSKMAWLRDLVDEYLRLAPQPFLYGNIPQAPALEGQKALKVIAEFTNRSPP